MAVIDFTTLNPAPANAVHTFTFTATGASVTLDIGFKPSVFEVIDLTTRFGYLVHSGMTSGHGLKTADTGTRSYATSGAPTYYDGAEETGSGDGHAPGINITYASSEMLVSGDEILVIAYR